MRRRNFMMGSLATIPALGFGLSGRAASGEFEVTRSEAEWRAMLSDREYHVMREEGTEPAHSSPLDKIYEPGTYHCRGCDLPLYAARHKFDSGTGWPSFVQALPDAIGTRPDDTLFQTRTECHCGRCGSHLGHIFDDGPEPTGKRHCINGVSLVFRSA